MEKTLHFKDSDASELEPFLPTETLLQASAAQGRPFVTLTFATSLDSSLSLAPGTRTRLSGPESKAMTHHLRSRHDAICIGVGTAVADDPGLNCRIEGVGLDRQPRPVVIDPRGRWDLTARSKVLEVARAGLGLAPFMVTAHGGDVNPELRTLLEEHGGKVIEVDTSPGGGGDGGDGGGPGDDGSHPGNHIRWGDILAALLREGLRSVMIEGGGRVINSLLAPACHDLVDSVIVTIAPTWLGQGSVNVSPDRVHDERGDPVPPARLSSVSWHPFGEDAVLCGRLGHNPGNP
ncbi:5-amino-6-uracil reductase [Sodiomyces alkalinus F11]|uniref:2,5-diamino-6-ribosylamino-4(3H)-pyrimidinone 5'-phosphate reductase n=1 Tax=Sodiomyces alkalinus (strain CBS 110278 / VKM F-3762 / F11) TaxID=1314773 RepID=A0A3N2Q1Q5_SODAK|nr:5-amino-6-uracil reductase [Sodiomyces alkalinus F11]ROT40689.1 5-amino-6-uracil reductase [Sodiomyces alkalinus F11]